MFKKSTKLFLFTSVFSMQLSLHNSFAIPKTGWTCKNITDLGPGVENHSHCQKPKKNGNICNKKIRYVHTMKHENYDEELDVGSSCAEKMDVNAKVREENYKIRQKLSRKKLEGWEPLSPGNYDNIILKEGDFSISVWKETKGVHSGQYSYNVSGPSHLWFNTITAAQQAAINEKWPLFLTN